MSDAVVDPIVEPGNGPGSSPVPPRGIWALGLFLGALMVAGLAIAWRAWPSCDAAPLVLSGVTPGEGPPSGGTPVVLTGAGFDDSVTVLFGGQVLGHERRHDGHLRVTTPRRGAGAVDVSVVARGCIASTRSGAFRFGPGGPPAAIRAAAVEPPAGPAAGGARVPAAAGQPALTAGTQTEPGDISLSAIQPDSGGVGGCDVVTLTGTGFADGVHVTFGGVPAAGVTVLTPTSISAVAPRHRSGKVDVTVSLRSTARLPGAYTYVCPAPEGSGLLLAVLLAGAVGALLHAIRSFYDYVGARKLVVSWVPMYLLLPVCGAALAGIFHFLVGGGLFPLAGTSPGAGFVGFAALVGLFSAQAIERLKGLAEGLLAKVAPGTEPLTGVPLTVASVSPGTGVAGTPVRIVGTGFGSGTSVEFGGVAAVVQIVSDKEIATAAPSGFAAGTTVDVTVKRGTKPPAVRPQAFTY